MDFFGRNIVFNDDDETELLLLSQQRRRSGGGVFGPPLTGLKLWLKADAITGLNDGDPIATWVDSSGNGNDATEGVAASRPIYKTNIVNGLPVARMDGVDDGMLTANTVFTANPISFFVVYSANSNVANRRAINGSGPGDWLIGPYNNNYQFFDGAFINAGAITAGVFKLSTAIHTAAPVATFWLNGVSIGSNVPVRLPNRLGLGIRGTSVEPLDGDLAEVLGYDIDMTSQRLAVESYLTIKYAL